MDNFVGDEVRSNFARPPHHEGYAQAPLHRSMIAAAPIASSAAPWFTKFRPIIWAEDQKCVVRDANFVECINDYTYVMIHFNHAIGHFAMPSLPLKVGMSKAGEMYLRDG